MTTLISILSGVCLFFILPIITNLIADHITQKSKSDPRFTLNYHLPYLKKGLHVLFGVYLRELVVIGSSIVLPFMVMILGFIKFLEFFFSTASLELAFWRSLPIFLLAFIWFIVMRHLYKVNTIKG